MTTDREEFERQLEAAVKFHGHLCGGQVIGVRMALAGLRELGITDPHATQRKDFIVIVETDRCATDAIIVVTGLTPGKRSIKILDFGKMAATFVHLKSGRAIRVHALESSREKATALAKSYAEAGGKDAYLEALIDLPEKDLISIRKVSVQLDPSDLPGSPGHYEVCSGCGETILDKREITLNNKTFCKPCALAHGNFNVLDRWPGIEIPFHSKLHQSEEAR